MPPLASTSAVEPAASCGLLDVHELSVWFEPRRGEPPLPPAVDGVSFTVGERETFGIVGASGSGKTLTALAIMRLLPRGARMRAQRIALRGSELQERSERELRTLRGRELAIVFQEPLTSLSPSVRIGRQLTETLRAHRAATPAQARERAVELLARVGIARARERMEDYPHQLSGGMRQRVTIAMALLLEPRLLLADEPTTALDATVQAQLLELLAELREERAMSLVLVSHDLSVVRELADRVAVMRDGAIIAHGAVADVLGADA